MEATASPAISIITAVLGGLGGLAGLAALLNAWYGRKKYPAEIRKNDAECKEAEARQADLISQAALRVVDRWEEQVRKLEARLEAQSAQIDEQGNIIHGQGEKLDEQSRTIQAQTVEMEGMRAEIRELTDGVERLIAQLLARNEEPAYRPRKKQIAGGTS